MSEVKIKALEKMNKEMSEKHGDYEDYIHNLLSDQDDDSLFEQILKEGKTIKSCLQYIENYAFKNCERTGNVGKYAPTPMKILELVKEYYASEETEVKSAFEGVASASYKPKSKIKKASKIITKKEVEKKVNEMSIFDFMDDSNDEV